MCSMWTKTDGADTADTTGVTITTTTGSKTVTTADTTNIKRFDQVSGTGIPAGATVTKVVNSTTFTISLAATATGSPTNGAFVHKNTNKPKFQTVAEQKATYGVDVNEIKLTPATHTGWVKVTSYSGARAGRKLYETIVAMGTMGLNAGGTAVTSDAEDTVFPDPTITITAQPTVLTAVDYTSVTPSTPVTLGVTLSVAALGKTTTTYQWTSSSTSGGTYTNITNGSEYAGVTTNTLVIKSKAQDTKFYKLAVTATPPVGSPLTALSNAAKVAGGVLVTAGSWSTTATITAAGHNLVSTDTAVVSGVTPSGYNTVSTGAVMTVSGNTLNYASTDPGGVVTAPFTGLVYKYVA